MKRRFQRFLQTSGGKWLKAFAISLLVFSSLISLGLIYVVLCIWLAAVIGTIFGPAGSVAVGIAGLLVLVAAIAATSITL